MAENSTFIVLMQLQMIRLNDHRNRGSAQCNKDQVGPNMALVTLALTSEEILTYPTADLKDLQPPCSIQSLSETPLLAAKVAPPQGVQAKLLRWQAHLLEHF